MSDIYAQIPRDAQPMVLNAMMTVATQAGTRDAAPTTVKLVEAAGERLFAIQPGTVSWNPISPSDLAAALTGETERELATELLSIIPFADKQLTESEIAIVHSFANALGVEPFILADLDRLKDEKYNRLAFDYGRRGLGAFIGTDSRWAKLHQVARELRLKAGDKRLAEKYHALEALPDGTLGNAFFHFYQDRGFAFPGEKHCLGEIVTKHDALHILSGCNTDAPGEINVAGVEAGMVGSGVGYEFLMETLALFQDGIDFEHSSKFGITVREDSLDPDTLMLNIRKGMDMSTNIFAADWDFWAATRRQLDELRSECGVNGVDGSILPTVPLPPPSEN